MCSIHLFSHLFLSAPYKTCHLSVEFEGACKYSRAVFLSKSGFLLTVILCLLVGFPLDV